MDHNSTEHKKKWSRLPMRTTSNLLFSTEKVELLDVVEIQRCIARSYHIRQTRSREDSVSPSKAKWLLKIFAKYVMNSHYNHNQVWIFNRNKFGTDSKKLWWNVAKFEHMYEWRGYQTLCCLCLKQGTQSTFIGFQRFLGGHKLCTSSLPKTRYVPIFIPRGTTTAGKAPKKLSLHWTSTK